VRLKKVPKWDVTDLVRTPVLTANRICFIYSAPELMQPYRMELTSLFIIVSDLERLFVGSLTTTGSDEKLENDLPLKAGSGSVKESTKYPCNQNVASCG
jgi:hypothetical protein